jgi:hypothetical protein
VTAAKKDHRAFRSFLLKALFGGTITALISYAYITNRCRLLIRNIEHGGSTDHCVRGWGSNYKYVVD